MLGLFPLKKRRFRKDLITVFQDLKGGCREDRSCLFPNSHIEKTEGNGYKLRQERFHHYIRTKFFTVRTIIHGNHFPSDMLESPLLEVFKMQLDRMLDNFI